MIIQRRCIPTSIEIAVPHWGLSHKFVNNFLDNRGSYSLKLGRSQGFMHLLLHIDRRKALSEDLLDVPGGYEFLIGGNKDASPLRKLVITMFSTSAGLRERMFGEMREAEMSLGR
ncbi:unnamed protein product [Sphagnum balticum]